MDSDSPGAARSTLFFRPRVLFHPQPPRRAERTGEHILGRFRQANMCHSHPSPSTWNRQEYIRQFPDKVSLLLGSEHQIAVALLFLRRVSRRFCQLYGNRLRPCESLPPPPPASKQFGENLRPSSWANPPEQAIRSRPVNTRNGDVTPFATGPRLSVIPPNLPPNRRLTLAQRSGPRLPRPHPPGARQHAHPGRTRTHPQQLGSSRGHSPDNLWMKDSEAAYFTTPNTNPFP